VEGPLCVTNTISFFAGSIDGAASTGSEGLQPAINNQSNEIINKRMLGLFRMCFSNTKLTHYAILSD